MHVLLRPSVLVVALLGSAAHGGPDALEKAVSDARTVAAMPQTQPPSWTDQTKLKAGLAFLRQHGATVQSVLAGSSLASTFAAKDVTPVLMATGKLPKGFVLRMAATAAYVGAMVAPAGGRDAFVAKNYAKAVALGELHHDVAEGVAPALAWDQKVRVPMSGQAMAFVLESFAWWPVEAMIAKKELDPKAEREGLEGWFHLWSVLGYGMGVPEALLPRDFATAGRLVTLLRKAQYARPGEPLPEGQPTLLGNHVRMLAGMAAQSAKRAGDASATPASMIAAAAKAFADQIALSPGLGDALGLGKDPVARLTEYATPAKP